MTTTKMTTTSRSMTPRNKKYCDTLVRAIMAGRLDAWIKKHPKYVRWLEGKAK
jgi:hypothetical protein